MTSTIGIPIKLLNEATGHQVTVEITSGQTYRGKLIEAEDNMNVQLENINVTQRDGRVTHLDRVYIRGSHVRLFIVPDMLRNAPMFKAKGGRGRGVGLARGRATVNRAQGSGGPRGGGRGRDLTGSAPKPNVDGSIAGLIHEWDVKTAYYAAKVPIWIDEVSDIASWKADFLRPEAKEVIEAVGALVYCFERQKGGAIPKDVEDAMKSIQEVVEEHAGYEADCVMLAVAKPVGMEAQASTQTSRNDQDEICMESGFEYIDYTATGNNEFGEKVGVERLKEALEANEWDAGGDEDDLGVDLENLGLDDEFGLGVLGQDEAEITAELFGMKAALNGHDAFDAETDDVTPHDRQASEVDDLERIMVRLLAVKQQGADLPEAQRRRLAAKAVQDLFQADSSN